MPGLAVVTTSLCTPAGRGCTARAGGVRSEISKYTSRDSTATDAIARKDASTRPRGVLRRAARPGRPKAARRLASDG